MKRIACTSSFRNAAIAFACRFYITQASTTQAEVLTFEFSGLGDASTQFQFTATSSLQTSPTISVTPSELPAGGLPSLIFRGPDGLGVDTRDPGSDTLVQLIDNNDAAFEFIDIVLSDLGGYTEIEVVSVTFRNLENAPVVDDDVRLQLNSSGVHYDPGTDAEATGEATYSYPVPQTYALGDSLRISPLDTPQNDDFSVFSMTVNAIPEPTSLLVFAFTAMALLCLQRKRPNQPLQLTSDARGS